jgi:nucleoside-triphosphatase THEP1/heme/copper-type cytochrome/quinol oxidase subunit 2
MSRSPQTQDDLHRSLWEVVDTLMVFGAIAVTALLVAAYFQIDSFGWTKPTKELTLAVIGNSIPVFIIFFLSAFGLRRIEKLRSIEDKNALVEAVAKRVALEVAHPSADRIFKHRTPEAPIIENAKLDVLMVQETGSLVAESARSEILGLLKRGGRVRIAVTSPLEPIATLMAFRNATLTTPTSLVARAKRFRDHMEEFQRASLAGVGRIEVRYIHYPIGSTITLVDSTIGDMRKSRAVVRVSGFKIPFEAKLDYQIDGESSPNVIESMRREANDIYFHSSKCVLLQGEPRSGKTTLLRELIHKYPSEDVAWILSEAIWDTATPGQREGFQVRSSEDPSASRKFATRQPDGTYLSDDGIWDHYAVTLRAAAKAGKVIVLDEIGPLQLRSQAFRTALDDAFKNPAVHLFASIAEPRLLDPAVHQSYWNFFRTTQKTLEKDSDRDAIFRELVTEFTASCVSASAWTAILKLGPH